MATKEQKEKPLNNPPHIRRCGAVSVHHRLLETYPGFRRNQIELESIISQRMRSGMVARKGKPTLVPVVVHVVHKLPVENISDSQVKSQIKVLNADYSATNIDKSQTPAVWSGLITSANIQFELATKDPDGKPTNGITRTKTTNDSFPSDDSVKSNTSGGADPWPTDRYLNIWVCNLGEGLLGYAQFPGGPPSTDGVVILHSGFGTEGTAAAPFNKGRTATHEIGHYFNLHHIWGDNSIARGLTLLTTHRINSNPISASRRSRTYHARMVPMEICL